MLMKPSPLCFSGSQEPPRLRLGHVLTAMSDKKLTLTGGDQVFRARQVEHKIMVQTKCEFRDEDKEL